MSAIVGVRGVGGGGGRYIFKFNRINTQTYLWVRFGKYKHSPAPSFARVSAMIYVGSYEELLGHTPNLMAGKYFIRDLQKFRLSVIFR